VSGQGGDGAKVYPSAFEEGTSHAHAVALLERAALGPGVVLDVGCGNAPVAEPLAALGFEYVGLDRDRAALEAVAARGFEVHELDLSVREARLARRLREVLGDRSLAAMLALDVLEHLVDPGAAVRALAALAQAHPGAALVASIPNVTHFDVAAGLLVGRWRMTPTGLLDDTHLRFYSEEGVAELLGGAGWREVDAQDTVAVHSDQYFVEPGPAWQAQAPLRNFLWRIRASADPHVSTYQFVRRYVLAPDPPPEPAAAPPASGEHGAPFVSVVVTVATDADREGLPTLLGDLATQERADLEVLLVVVGGPEPDHAASDLSALDTAGIAGRVVHAAVPGVAARHAAFPWIRGRYVCFLDGRDRVGPRWLSALARGAGDPGDPLRTDPVVRVDATTLDPDELAAGRDRSFEAVVDGCDPVRPDGFDLLSPELGTTALAAYAVPAALLGRGGLRFDPAVGDAATTAFVARAVELCGLRGVSDLQVAVERESARDGELDLAALRDHLSRGPYLFDGGGFARLVELRDHVRRARAAEERAGALAEELERERARRAGVEADLRDARAHLDAVFATKTWRATERLRGWYARLRGLRERLR
jgi:SAM-dependent methyltransferase